ncbi:MAG: hypothetical protein MI862_04885 [Desulfobacterales bacterium]|nr:hypothetical protein [Desulfobacterales bacterium]
MNPAQVPDGTTSKHPFECLNSAGEIVASVEAVKYRIVDKDNAVLKDWTLITPTVPSGIIVVDAEINRVRESRDNIRKISIVATHDGGKKKTGWIAYDLVDNPGIQTADDLSG